MASSSSHHPLPPPPGAYVDQGYDSRQQADYFRYQQSAAPQQQQQQQQFQYSPQQSQQNNGLPPPPPPHAAAQKQSQPPQQPTQPAPAQQRSQRPSSFVRRSRKLSFSGHGGLHESSAEKEAKRLHSKADPTLAMNEAEPSAVATGVKSSLAPLRSMQHKDHSGNVIVDPDRSNPTRPRLERPLETIMGFEAAIDGNYNYRTSTFIRPSDQQSTYTRRSGYYGQGGGRGNGRESYYGSRNPWGEASNHDLRQAPVRESYYEDGSGGGPAPSPYGGSGYLNPYQSNAGPSRRRGPPPGRYNTDPNYSSRATPEPGAGVYPPQSNQRSYETVASSAGQTNSSFNEGAGYQTDLTSSDGGSIDRVPPSQRQQQQQQQQQRQPQQQPQQKPQEINDYGIGFSQPQAYQPPGLGLGATTMSGGNGNGIAAPQRSAYEARPPVPVKDAGGRAAAPAPVRPTPEKRKSWFSKRFSRA